MVKQHYYICLERVPERYATWRGCQEAWEFEFKRLTWLQAVDVLKYPTKRAVAEHLVACGLAPHPRLSDTRWGCEPVDSAIHAYTASFMLAFHHIAEQPKGQDFWYVVWEADCVLNVPFRGFEKIFDNDSERPADAEILLLSGPRTTLKPHRSYVDREICETHPHFYVGCPGNGASKCTGVKPEGAQQILDIFAKEPYAYDAMMVAKADAFSGLYTLSFPITRETNVSGISGTAGTAFKKEGHVDRNNKYHHAILNDHGEKQVVWS